MIQEVDYHGWKSLTLGNAQVEVVIPLDIGPRIVACRSTGGQNLFHNVAAELGGKNETEWCLRGGHRLWHSPEQKPRTYDLDNVSVAYETLAGEQGLLLKAPAADLAGIYKTIQIELVGESTFKLTHTLRNDTMWPIECAPWALTVMERGGYSTIPLLPKGDHEKELLPNCSWIPWTYTDLSLPQWQIKKDFIGIDTTQAKVPQKLGLTNYPGWAAYWQEAGTFVKAAPVQVGKTYPDFGCVYETFCNDFMIELETLAPLEPLAPGETVQHVEYWGVFADLPKPDTDVVWAETFKPAMTQWHDSLVW